MKLKIFLSIYTIMIGFINGITANLLREYELSETLVKLNSINCIILTVLGMYIGISTYADYIFYKNKIEKNGKDF